MFYNHFYFFAFSQNILKRMEKYLIKIKQFFSTSFFNTSPKSFMMKFDNLNKLIIWCNCRSIQVVANLVLFLYAWRHFI